MSERLEQLKQLLDSLESPQKAERPAIHLHIYALPLASPGAIRALLDALQAYLNQIV